MWARLIGKARLCLLGPRLSTMSTVTANMSMSVGANMSTTLASGHPYAWTVNGKDLDTMDVAGGLPAAARTLRRSLTGQPAKHKKYLSSKDPRYNHSPSWSFGSRSSTSLDTLADNNPMFWNGTHRARSGELLLGADKYVCKRDEANYGKLKEQGRHWKATPGPGTYRIPRAIGSHVEDKKTEFQMSTATYPDRAPSFRIGTGNARGRMYATIGGGGHDRERPDSDQESWGYRRLPTPRNLSPGPGRYFQDVDIAPSSFSNYGRPQGRQVV